MDQEAARAAVAGASPDSPEEEPPSIGKAAISPARAGDLDALVELEQETFAGDRVSRRSFRRFLNAGNAIVLVARDGGRVAGYAIAVTRRDSDAARLYSIAVDPRMRGRGLGARLLAAAERAARKRDCQAMRLEVREDNRRAIDLYTARGYRPFGRLAGYYHDGADALRFARDFGGAVRESARAPRRKGQDPK